MLQLLTQRYLQQQEKKQADEKLEQANLQLQQAKQQTEQADQQLQQAKQQTEQAKQQLQQATEQLHTTTTQLNDKSTQLNQTMQHLNQTNTELRNVQKQLEDREAQLAQTQKELTETTTQLKQAQQEAQLQKTQLQKQVECAIACYNTYTPPTTLLTHYIVCTQIQKEVDKRLLADLQQQMAQIAARTASPDSPDCASEAAASQPAHKTCHLRLEPPPSDAAAAGTALSVTPASPGTADTKHALVDKQFHMWLGEHDDNAKDQFFTLATVTKVVGQTCQILLSDIYHQDFHEQQEYSYDKTVKAVQLFETGEIINPDPPVMPPHTFEILKVVVDSECKDKFATRDFIRSSAFSRAVWHNAFATGGEMAYLWQNDIAKTWHLGLSIDEPLYRTTKAAAYAHEAHDWQVMHGDRRVEVRIVFKAHMHLPPRQGPDRTKLTAQGSSGAGGSAGAASGAAGGRAGASSGGPAASGASPASRSSTGSSRTSAAGAGGGPSHAAAQDAADRLKEGDPLCISFDPEDEKEGFFHARIACVDYDMDKVTFKCNRNTGGFFTGFVNELTMVGSTSYSQALLYHMDFVWDRNIRKPHPGPFSSVYVSHATSHAGSFKGNYTITEDRVNDKPVWDKDQKTDYRVTRLWYSADGKAVFGQYNEHNIEAPYKPFAVAQQEDLWPHYTRDFVLDDYPCRIFSYAIKAQAPAIALPQSAVAPPQQAPRAVLEVGQAIYAFYPIAGTKAGYAVAKITKIDGLDVTYECTDGKLQKQALTINRDLAQSGRTAYLAHRTAPDPPYTGSFKSVFVFKCNYKDLEGMYVATTKPAIFNNDKPVFRKESDIPGFVTALWHSDDGKWVISCLSAASHAQCRTPYFRHPPYAATADTAEWPHRTHDWVLVHDGGKNVKVLSYSIKTDPVRVVSLLDDDDDSEDDSSDDGEGDAAGAPDEGGTRAPRKRRPPARDTVDPAIANHFAGTRVRTEKKRKRSGEKGRDRGSKTGSSRGAEGGAAHGPAGGAGGVR